MSPAHIRKVKEAMAAFIGDEFIEIELAKSFPVWTAADRDALDAIAYSRGVLTDGGILVRFA